MHNEAAAADGSAYLGRYYSEEIDTYYHVERRESSTVIVRQKYPPTVLKPLGGDSFAIANFSNVVPSATVRFTRDGNGHVSGFVMDSDRMRGFEFTRA